MSGSRLAPASFRLLKKLLVTWEPITAAHRTPHIMMHASACMPSRNP